MPSIIPDYGVDSESGTNQNLWCALSGGWALFAGIAFCPLVLHFLLESVGLCLPCRNDPAPVFTLTLLMIGPITGIVAAVVAIRLVPAKRWFVYVLMSLALFFCVVSVLLYLLMIVFFNA